LKHDNLTQSQRRYEAATIEIQVASVLMHAWAEVEHDLLYKTLQGTPSQDEIAILDELNGMVLAGEIALERLQRSIESRVVREPDARFANEFELQAFLSSKIPDNSAAKIGVIDFLFQLLQDAKLDTPTALAKYLNEVDFVDDSESLSDQLIDLITSEDPQKYQLFLAIWRKFRDKFTYSGIDVLPPTRQKALGHFLTQWIELERRIIQLAGTSSRVLTTKVIKELLEKMKLDVNTISAIQGLRLLRNEVVHGQSLPDPRVLSNAAEQIRDLLESKLPPAP
jgi:hypothetical protein